MILLAVELELSRIVFFHKQPPLRCFQWKSQYIRSHVVSTPTSFFSPVDTQRHLSLSKFISCISRRWDTLSSVLWIALAVRVPHHQGKSSGGAFAANASTMSVLSPNESLSKVSASDSYVLKGHLPKPYCSQNPSRGVSSIPTT